MNSLYLRYLGVLGLLCECAVYLDDEDREMIAIALDDACDNHPLRWNRVGNRFEIFPVPDSEESV